MTDATAKNLAQNVAAAFIRREHTIIDKEGSRASVVGDDAEAGVTHQRG